uniref:Uncharacterized protein n=1 Tax=Trypanosoma vivax (strain Y486) TaxID=1055687 RepID=G0TRM8_TRYVY|nr:hypothetical protein, unlikely [Trypanosoma vivax Y486]
MRITGEWSEGHELRKSVAAGEEPRYFLISPLPIADTKEWTRREVKNNAHHIGPVEYCLHDPSLTWFLLSRFHLFLLLLLLLLLRLRLRLFVLFRFVFLLSCQPSPFLDSLAPFHFHPKLSH